MSENLPKIGCKLLKSNKQWVKILIFLYFECKCYVTSISFTPIFCFPRRFPLFSLLITAKLRCDMYVFAFLRIVLFSIFSFCFYVAVRSKEFYTFSKLIAFDSVVGYASYYLVSLFTISIYFSFTLSVMFICLLQPRNCFITWIH